MGTQEKKTLTVKDKSVNLKEEKELDKIKPTNIGSKKSQTVTSKKTSEEDEQKELPKQKVTKEVISEKKIPKDKANEKTEKKSEKKKALIEMQSEVNEPEEIRKENMDSDAVIKLKEKVYEDQKPSVQLKVDDKPKAKEKTETKIEKKEAPMKMQVEENEPKEVKKEKEDSD